MSNAIDFGFKKSRVAAHGQLACIFLECCQIHDEESRPLLIFVHADSVQQICISTACTVLADTGVISRVKNTDVTFCYLMSSITDPLLS